VGGIGEGLESALADLVATRLADAVFAFVHGAQGLLDLGQLLPPRRVEVGQDLVILKLLGLLGEIGVEGALLLPQMIAHGTFTWPRQRRAVTQEAVRLLDEMGLSERLRHRPAQLSGGERQRVAIARALVTRPALLLCDEPTGNLDERTSDTITELLLDLQARHGVTLVLVTHDEELAERADRCLHLTEGSLLTEPGES